MELLPAQRDTRILCKRAPFNERTLSRHDAAIIVCEREHAVELIGELPFANIWRRLYKEARARGAVTLISARLTEAASPIVIAFAKGDASAFERLTLAARAWKELNAPTRWEFSFLDEAALRRRSAGAFLAVSRANEHIPTDFTGFGVRFTTQLLLDHDLLAVRRKRDAPHAGKLANWQTGQTVNRRTSRRQPRQPANSARRQTGQSATRRW